MSSFLILHIYEVLMIKINGFFMKMKIFIIIVIDDENNEAIE